MKGRPLHGCRILDLGIITAGAATSAVLADLGAEVIKVESRQYRDPFREWKPVRGDAPQAGMPPFFTFTNRGKRGISLDLKHPDGHAAFLRLVRRSHVVLENFRRGVLDRLGIGLAALRAANPDIILAAISSQGETGPDARYVSFGTTLEAFGGLAGLTGYPDGPPVASGREVNYPDQIVAIFAAGMVATAWRVQQQGGGGGHLDMSQRELASFLVGESFVAASGGQPVTAAGNAEPPFLLQDCFQAADGAWIALSIAAADCPRLDALVTPAAGDEPHRVEAVRRWIAGRPAADALAALTAPGLAAAPVMNSLGILEQQGQFWDFALRTAKDGTLVKGFPFQLAPVPLEPGRPAPMVGADTQAVLAELGGYDREEIAALEAAGAIETGSAEGQTVGSPAAS